MTIRSKHNDLLNYFMHDARDLSPAYVKKCERFLWSLRNAGLITKQAANTLYRLQASSSKRHDPRITNRGPRPEGTSNKLDKSQA